MAKERLRRFKSEGIWLADAAAGDFPSKDAIGDERMKLSRFSLKGIAEERHYSGVYPLWHKGDPHVHFRVHLASIPLT